MGKIKVKKSGDQTPPYLVAVYVRVSTDKQEVENQLFALRKYCETNDYTIFDEYVDVISGAKQSRPAFDKLFSDAKKKLFRMVLFWDLSRFSRSGIVFTMQKLKELDNLGVDWHSYQEAYFSSLGDFKDMVLAIMSEIVKIERLKISERTKAGLRRARMMGKKVGQPKKDPLIYRKYCDMPKCRHRIRFDEVFCKKHKEFDKVLQNMGGAKLEEAPKIEARYRENKKGG